MDNSFVVRKLYDLIKGLVPYASLDTINKILEADGHIPLTLTDDDLPREFNLGLDDLYAPLKELSMMGLIKIDGMPERLMGWSSRRARSGPNIGQMRRVRTFRISLLKFVDSEGIFKNDGKPQNIENTDDIEKEPTLDEKNKNLNNKPYTEVKNGIGYFKFYKEGPSIKIGKAETRQFRLLQCLTEPHFGIQKTIEAVFEAIKQPKDEEDTRLSEMSPRRKSRMLEIIEYSKKELQKIKELQGKIKYCMDNRKQNMWLK